MRDRKDKATGNLLASAGARRQAAFKARMLERGYKRATIWLHEASWKDGYESGKSRGMEKPPEGCEDALSWYSGYIDGKTGIDSSEV
tara:strand:- start:544 stop:804 length:261 start_codon:yes stop_codon:yes gene_type:complete